MNLIFTVHAKQRILERNIKIEDVENAIYFPDYTISKNGIIESYKKIDNKNLKIIYLEEGKFIKVITVIDKL